MHTNGEVNSNRMNSGFCRLFVYINFCLTIRVFVCHKVMKTSLVGIIISGVLLKLYLCYEIPLVKLDLLSNGFTLSLADDPGIRNVFYVIRINDKCPGLMELLLKANGQVWSTTQTSVTLQNQDNLKLSILVNHNGEAFKSAQYIKVGVNNNKAAAYRISSPQSTKCGGKSMPKPDICEPSETVVWDGTQVCKNQLIFEDNFNDTDVNLEKWSFEIRNLLTSKPEEEFVIFDSKRENIFLHDGHLNIKPTVTQLRMKEVSIDFDGRCTPVWRVISECRLVPSSPVFAPPVFSAQIHTRETFNFKYGRVEIKAKLPKGNWLLPNVMLENYGPFERKQIRIAQARGNDQLQTSAGHDIGGRRLYGGWVIDGEKRTLNLTQTYKEEHFGNKFHIYSINWTKEAMTMAVDGVIYGEIKQNLDKFNEDFFLTLGVSAGGHLEFTDYLQNPSEKPWQNTAPRAIRNFWEGFKDGKIIWNGGETMLIDYVRVYAL